MEEQSFCVGGTAADTKNINVANLNGQKVIYWTDIKKVFPNAVRIFHDSSAVDLLEDSNQTR